MVSRAAYKINLSQIEAAKYLFVMTDIVNICFFMFGDNKH